MDCCAEFFTFVFTGVISSSPALRTLTGVDSALGGVTSCLVQEAIINKERQGVRRDLNIKFFIITGCSTGHTNPMIALAAIDF
jgi:hypothetical protein